jgi:hypothetical protein
MRARHWFLVLGWSAAAGSAVAQGLPPPFPQEEVLVVVWRDAGRCSVLDRKTTCARVAGLLNGTLQVGRERHIVVATEGEDEDVRIRAAQLMSDIRAAGYRNVRPAGMHR